MHFEFIPILSLFDAFPPFFQIHLSAFFPLSHSYLNASKPSTQKRKRAQRAHNFQRILQAARDFNLILNGIKMIWLNNLSFVHSKFSYRLCRAVRVSFFCSFFFSFFLFVLSWLVVVAFIFCLSLQHFLSFIKINAGEKVWVIEGKTASVFH